MSKYIRIYNELTKIMGIIELIFLAKVKPSYRNKDFIYGPYVYCKLITSKQTYELRHSNNFIMLPCLCGVDENGDVIKNKERHNCKNYHYEITKNIVDLNKMQDFNKYIMDSEGNIFTTLTGLIYLKYYYLAKENEVNHTYLTSHLQLSARTIYLKSNDLFCKNVRIIFLLKKKYKLPRPITYIIILKLCKIFLIDKEKRCEKCGLNNMNKNCINCNICGVCKTLNKNTSECDNCGVNFCCNCAYNEYYCNHC